MDFVLIEIEEDRLRALVEAGLLSKDDYVAVESYPAELRSEVVAKRKQIQAIKKQASEDYRLKMKDIDKLEQDINRLKDTN